MISLHNPHSAKSRGETVTLTRTAATRARGTRLLGRTPRPRPFGFSCPRVRGATAGSPLASGRRCTSRDRRPGQAVFAHRNGSRARRPEHLIAGEPTRRRPRGSRDPTARVTMADENWTERACCGSSPRAAELLRAPPRARRPALGCFACRAAWGPQHEPCPELT